MNVIYLIITIKRPYNLTRCSARAGVLLTAAAAAVIYAGPGLGEFGLGSVATTLQP